MLSLEGMLAEVLRGQGRIEDKVDNLLEGKLIEEMDSAEDEAEMEDEPMLSANPALHSPMLEMDFEFPQIF